MVEKTRHERQAGRCQVSGQSSQLRLAFDDVVRQPHMGNGNLEWARIEALLIALGCRVIEGPGSAVTFEHNGRKANFHRPHPAKEALRYRVKAAREFIEKIGVSA